MQALAKNRVLLYSLSIILAVLVLFVVLFLATMQPIYKVLIVVAVLCWLRFSLAVLQQKPSK